jgi:hypothetical protein
MEPPNHPDDLNGKTLVERYLIKGKLGHGGMGSIYTAHDNVLDRDVAIKTIARTGLNDVELVRFHREGKAASTVRHPNVIQMLDFGVLETGQPFIVMELINGTSVAQLILEQKQLSPLFTLQIVEQSAAGMSAVHKAGIIHRDLKTSNIMIVDLETGPLVRILDFGIAKSISNDSQTSTLTKAGQIFGSPHYMSPEQVKGDHLNQQTDVYSLGCITFEMLTGVTLFQGETVMDVVTQHMTEPAPRLWEVTDIKFPMELERLVAHMVAKDTSDRFGSMEEVIENIKEVRIVVEDAAEQEKVAARAAAALSKELAETQAYVHEKPKTGMLIVALVIATGLLIGAVYTIIQPMFKKEDDAVQKVPAKVDDTSRKRLLERAQFDMQIVDNLTSASAQTGLIIDHSGKASVTLRQLLKTGEPVNAVTLVDASFTLDDAKSISRLHPRKVILRGCTGITDDVLKELAKIKTIKTLNISLCKTFTPRGLGYLAALPALTGLYLEDCNLTDAHLKEMKKIQTLLHVGVAKNRKITLNGLKQLGGKVMTLGIFVDQPQIYLTSKEKQLEMKTKYNILLLYPQDPGSNDGFEKFTKGYGLDELDCLKDQSILDDPLLHPSQKEAELIKRHLE